MNLNVNGRMHEIESPPLTTLLDVLREELGVHSPKVGCEQGGCGACTVLVEGAPKRACLLPVAALDGAAITTVEGLGAPEHLEPVQAAFVHHYAAQCGFCTSGLLMAATAYVETRARGILVSGPSASMADLARWPVGERAIHGVVPAPESPCKQASSEPDVTTL